MELRTWIEKPHRSKTNATLYTALVTLSLSRVTSLDQLTSGKKLIRTELKGPYNPGKGIRVKYSETEYILQQDPVKDCFVSCTGGAGEMMFAAQEILDPQDKEDTHTCWWVED